jgi:hypothetical protein
MFARRVSRFPKNGKRSWSLCRRTNRILGMPPIYKTRIRDSRVLRFSRAARDVRAPYLVCWFQPRRFVRL